MSSAPVARRAERRRKELMARQRGHRLASEPKRHGLAQAQLVQPWASPRPGSQTERGEPAGIHAVPYVEAPGLTDRRQSGRRINPLPGGWTRGFRPATPGYAPGGLRRSYIADFAEQTRVCIAGRGLPTGRPG